MKKSRTFLDRNLQEILSRILPPETPGDFYQSPDMAPTFRGTLPYSAQYNETNFEYLKRLATRYGQWFYWDGMRLQFGIIKDSKVKLISGSSVHGFTTEVHFAPQKVSLAGYDYEQGAKIQASQRKVSGGSSDGLAAHMAQKQHDYFIRDMDVSAYTGQAADEAELNEMAQLQAAAAAASSITYSGTSYEPLGVGRTFIVMNGQVEHRLVAVSVQHLSDNHGNYRCEFTALPADVAAPPYTDPHCYARAETQPAKVVDNNDPQGLGRVKVFFYWGSKGNKETDWIRMVQPHSGGGKGFYFIPEIGEEVLVGFEGGNAEKPYVIGTQYNGKQSSGYSTPGNDQKVIHSRSGTKIILNDAEGSVFIEDPSGSTYLMDGKGNINVNAPNRITFNCTDMDINVTNNLSTTVGVNKTESIGVDASENVGGLKSTTVAGDMNLRVAGMLDETIDGDIQTHTKKEMVMNSQKGMAYNTEGEIAKHSGSGVQLNSAEKSKLF
jgi:uncharacterized protein involved in type VI secretion and phage assembly